jgi:hypothetical protein
MWIVEIVYCDTLEGVAVENYGYYGPFLTRERANAWGEARAGADTRGIQEFRLLAFNVVDDDGRVLPTLREIFGEQGPDDVEALLKDVEAIGFHYLSRSVQPPEWVVERVKGLRPLSRKFLHARFGQHGYVMEENEYTRSLGFFGDWKPA